jgi:hypothetical protein
MAGDTKKDVLEIKEEIDKSEHYLIRATDLYCGFLEATFNLCLYDILSISGLVSVTKTAGKMKTYILLLHQFSSYIL